MSEIVELFIGLLRELLDAETQLIAAIPILAQATGNPTLRRALEKHFVETETHVERLKEMFRLLGAKAEPTSCRAMKGLIEEGSDTLRAGEKLTPSAADLLLIAAVQRVEHYGISSYGTARNLARHLGQYQCATLLTRTLGEEKGFDLLLTAIGDPITRQLAIAEGGHRDLDSISVPDRPDLRSDYSA